MWSCSSLSISVFTAGLLYTCIIDIIAIIIHLSGWIKGFYCAVLAIDLCCLVIQQCYMHCKKQVC